MSVRKLMLLGLAALMVLAFAIPATASAEEFTRWEGPVAEGGETETYAGSIHSSNAAFSLDCDVEAEITFEAEQAHFSSYLLHNCELQGYGGAKITKMENTLFVGASASFTAQGMYVGGGHMIEYLQAPAYGPVYQIFNAINIEPEFFGLESMNTLSLFGGGSCTGGNCKLGGTLSATGPGGFGIVAS